MNSVDVRWIVKCMVVGSEDACWVVKMCVGCVGSSEDVCWISRK